MPSEEVLITSGHVSLFVVTSILENYRVMRRHVWHEKSVFLRTVPVFIFDIPMMQLKKVTSFDRCRQVILHYACADLAPIGRWKIHGGTSRSLVFYTWTTPKYPFPKMWCGAREGAVLSAAIRKLDSRYGSASAGVSFSKDLVVEIQHGCSHRNTTCA